MKFSLVIFDFDGTLADSFPWFLSVLNKLAEKYSFLRIDEQELPALRSLGNRALLKHLQISFWKLPFLARDMRRMAKQDGSKIMLHVGVEDLLLGLKAQEKKIAVVTSNSEENVRRILGASLAEQVDYFECGASLFGKHRLLKKTLRRMKIQPRDAIYIGDETRDQEAAQRAGVKFGFVLWGYAAPDAFRGLEPEFTFQEPAEILK